MAQQIQLRNDSTANWASENPTLAQGEIGVDTTLGKMKIGDGTTTWNNLAFYAGGGGNEIIPLPNFLEYFTGRDHLPVLNSNFGWDSNGLWFGNAISLNGPGSLQSYPVATDGVFQEFDKVVVTFDMQVDDFCSDLGICVYPTGEAPRWNWGTDGTRIAAQFNCVNPEIWGMSSSASNESSADNIPTTGTFRVRFTYDPNAETEKVVFELLVQDGNQFDQISRLTLNEQFELNGGTYKIGFASDNSADDEMAQNAPYITYMSNLTIDVNDGETILSDSLQNGYSGAILNLIAPLVVSDVDGNNLLRIEKSSVGTTRIDALQDDLALRSSRDIILYPGDDGPGNVYIGWGDANYTPNATNRVATLADIDSAPKTWSATNDVQYTIRQAHGGVEVTTTAESILDTEVDVAADQVGQTVVQLRFSIADDTALNDLLANSYIRSMFININGSSRVLRYGTRISSDETSAIYQFTSDTPLTLLTTDNNYGFVVKYGVAPLVWWNADDLGFIQDSNDYWHFRGAKIDYHAFVADGGTLIGTIYIAADSDDTFVTHIETSSGGNDVGALNLWYRKPYSNQSEERKLYLYRTDGEGRVHKIHWTAQVYYAAENYGD